MSDIEAMQDLMKEQGGPAGTVQVVDTLVHLVDGTVLLFGLTALEYQQLTEPGRIWTVSRDGEHHTIPKDKILRIKRGEPYSKPA